MSAGQTSAGVGAFNNVTNQGAQINSQIQTDLFGF